jgi:hypothetical protein
MDFGGRKAPRRLSVVIVGFVYSGPTCNDMLGYWLQRIGATGRCFCFIAILGFGLCFRIGKALPQSKRKRIIN